LNSNIVEEKEISDIKINENIRSRTVLLIGSEGEQVGEIPTSKAISMAKEANLDLVLVADNANPPVAKILDYGKYRYELIQKQREAKRNQLGAEMKEVRFRLKIDQNDFNIKVNSIIKFLNAGDKVKVQIQFRGREQQHPEFGAKLLEKISEKISLFRETEDASLD
jgi:translation initiation factor IF-3